MDRQQRLGAIGISAGYALATIVICVALSWLAARISAAHLLNQANQQLADVEAGLPRWQWSLHKPRDLVAGRAFGSATVTGHAQALTVTSTDGTAFELGLPVASTLDLAHWPILQAELQSTAKGTLGLIWGSGLTPTCQATLAARFNPDTRSLRIDLRNLPWQSPAGGHCPPLGVAQMLRLRVQLPARASLHLASVALLTTEPMTDVPTAPIDLPVGNVEPALAPAQAMAMPLFRLPESLSAEAMLSLRDTLRARWPAALIVPAGAMPQALSQTSGDLAPWLDCLVYLAALAWFALRPVKGAWRPWLEIGACLLGPLWLVMGLNWGLYPTPVGLLAFGGGLAFALFIERRHLPRLWRSAPRLAWLWPMEPLPITVVLIVLFGHKLHPLPLGHVLTYFGWALLQQWLMLVVVLRRFEQIAEHRRVLTIIPVAILFALLHTPNGVLMQLCFAAELFWAWCYLRWRRVLPIGVAHAVCALLVESGLAGGDWLRSLEVSARFFL
ncbi:CPBP family glutamic-type intramembrane protease [Dyella mobilis]|uniref:CPBP family intramembrane metalloprotease n=1 Tax=Dyella mobilis TaxID=1849582 RepID=A0ABS2KBM1_9GAMM|nr:CPBP family intramembrane glutamic endopeptidase [Dyella mobilis]MBM7128329.1 CPBP family intramembrane metalloprotease [Dyella mobilis]GLQ99632.1 hypothetical protein GCM10007863_40520 [Dyella mobilis]